MKKLFFGIILICHFSQAFAALTELSGRDILDPQKIETVHVRGKKALVVVFLSAICPCSNSHVEELVQLSKDYPDFSFVAIHSNTDESKEQTQAYFKKADLPFPALQDTQAQLADEFKALKTPHAFVILPNGEIAYQGGVSSSRHFDPANQKYLRDALADLKAQRPVKLKEGRTLGCVIMRGGNNAW